MKTFEANGRIPAYAVPKKVLLVKEIAKTSVGKIDKKLLRRQYVAALK